MKRAQIGFRKTDNAFLAVADVTALQAAADKLSPEIIRQRLDYWTLILGPKFSAKERKQLNLSRFYAIAQIEYCRNFIFKSMEREPPFASPSRNTRPRIQITGSWRTSAAASRTTISISAMRFLARW